MARDGRGGRRRRRRALRGFVGRASAGEGRGSRARPVHDDLQRATNPAAADGRRRRVCRRCALQGLGTAVGAASPDPVAVAATFASSTRGAPFDGRVSVTTSRIRAAAATTYPRELVRRRAGASRDLSEWVTREQSLSAPETTNPESLHAGLRKLTRESEMRAVLERPPCNATRA